VPYGKGIKTVLILEGIIILSYVITNKSSNGSRVSERISRISVLSFIGVEYLSTNEINSRARKFLLNLRRMCAQGSSSLRV